MATRLGPIQVHEGVCDASAAVFLRPGDTRFLLADDEDQHRTIIRMYDASLSGRPLREFHLSNEDLDPDPEEPEIDLEGSAWLGERIFWIGSHSRSKKGKARPSRHRLIATEYDGNSLTIAGKPYSTLMDDLQLELGLDLDNGKAPKEGGVSIEGLSSTENKGELLIAFRSPLVKGKALVIALTNAENVVLKDAAPKFGEPILLDLDGLGIRSLDYWPERHSYYLLAGPSGDSKASSSDNKEEFHLMRWSGPLSARPEIVDAVDFNKCGAGEGACPEALMIEPTSERMYVLFDEGNRIVDGVKCKEAERKSFRSVSVEGL